MQSQPIYPPATNPGRGTGKLLLLLLVFGAAGYAGYRYLSPSSSELQLKSEPIIERVEKIGKLAALKVFVSDIISSENAGFWSGVDGIWIIKGDAILTVDFARIQVMARDDTAKTVTLKLAPPQVESARVDHDRSGVYKLDTGVFTSAKEAGRMSDHAFKAGQENVRELAGLENNIDTARRNAEELLKNHLRMVGWEATVEWQAE